MHVGRLAPHRDPGRAVARSVRQAASTNISNRIPTALAEILRCREILRRSADDGLTFFGPFGTPSGPPEAINGRLEHLHGSAFSFGNLTDYLARSLVETGGFRPHLYPNL